MSIRRRLLHFSVLTRPFALRWLGALWPWLAARVALLIFTTPRPIPRPDWEVELMRSGRQLRLPSGIAITVWGEDSDPGVLLVHGWSGRGTQLGQMRDPLLAEGFRVIALDGPAHGASLGRRANIWLFAEAISEVAKVSTPVTAAVAHSFGAGAVAFALAQKWLKLEKVVLAAAPADLDWVVEAFCARFGFSSAVADSFRRQLEAWGGIDTGDVGIAKVGARLGEVQALIAHDPDDREVPFRDAQEIHRQWPGSILLPLDGVGHRKILKDRSFIEPAVAFLRASPDHRGFIGSGALENKGQSRS